MIPLGHVGGMPVEEAEGRTTVLLTHSALADTDAVRRHEDGWSQCLANLERALEA